MAYKSLYRKYRPTKFKDVSGQKFIVKTLEHAIENNKISHAYLFTGTRGTGKTTIAKIFAKMVNCLNMKENKPCGKCEICTNTNTDEIPDIIEIDAASNNGVDEIRELKNKIKLVPVLCKYKVYIIDEVHMLSTGAFNALLKTLEEPPEHVIFILATTEPQKIPITIISRCQRFDFKKIDINDITERLKYISEMESINIENLALQEIAKISDGAMRDAIGTLDQLASYSTEKITLDDIYMIKGSISYNRILQMIEYFNKEDIPSLLDDIEDIYNCGKDFSKLVEDMINVFRNMLIYKKAPNYFEKAEIINKDKIIELSKSIKENKLNKIIIELEELSKNIKISNYQKVLFEITLLKECQPNSVTDNNDIITEPKTVQKNEQEIIEKKEIQSQSNSKINLITSNKTINNVNVKESDVQIEKITNSNLIDKKALINNTIALATAKDKKNVELVLTKVDEYLINNKYKGAATIIKDSTLLAASFDHILFSYKYASMVEEFDEEINNITKMLKEICNTNYKIVAITNDDWKIQRPYYLELKKLNGKIEILEEVELKEKEKKKNSNIPIDEVVDIFGSDIVEMEG